MWANGKEESRFPRVQRVGERLGNLPGGREQDFPVRILEGGQIELRNSLARTDRCGRSVVAPSTKKAGVHTDSTLSGLERGIENPPWDPKIAPLGQVDPIYGGG